MHDWCNGRRGARCGTSSTARSPASSKRALRTCNRSSATSSTGPAQNSHRRDVTLDAQQGRKGEVQVTHVLPHDEVPISKWNRNPSALDVDTNRSSEDNRTFFCSCTGWVPITGILESREERIFNPELEIGNGSVCGPMTEAMCKSEGESGKSCGGSNDPGRHPCSRGKTRKGPQDHPTRRDDDQLGRHDGKEALHQTTRAGALPVVGFRKHDDHQAQNAEEEEPTLSTRAANRTLTPTRANSDIPTSLRLTRS